MAQSPNGGCNPLCIKDILEFVPSTLESLGSTPAPTFWDFCIWYTCAKKKSPRSEVLSFVNGALSGPTVSVAIFGFRFVPWLRTKPDRAAKWPDHGDPRSGCVRARSTGLFDVSGGDFCCTGSRSLQGFVLDTFP